MIKYKETKSALPDTVIHILYIWKKSKYVHVHSITSVLNKILYIVVTTKIYSDS